MILVILFSLLLSPVIHAEAPSAGAVKSPAATDGEYEIDYEEEPDAASEEAPESEPEPVQSKSVKKGAKASKNSGGPAVQGSRAKNRFAPILKSETKSAYKKEGKVLDVDAD
jgi:hypothetical protein